MVFDQKELLLWHQFISAKIAPIGWYSLSSSSVYPMYLGCDDLNLGVVDTSTLMHESANESARKCSRTPLNTFANSVFSLARSSVADHYK